MAATAEQFRGADGATSPRVLVLILNWNSPRETMAAAASVMTLDYPNFEVVILDNGSTDDSVAQLRVCVRDRAELIALPENVGYTGGCNKGFALAMERGIPYVWLLNSDALAEVSTLSSMVRLAQSDPAIGLVTPRIVATGNAARSLEAAGSYLPEVPSFTPVKNEASLQALAAEHPERLLLMGTAMLVNMAMVRAIGGFDPALFAYWEDLDLSVRALGAGYRTAVDFDSAVQHADRFTGPGAPPAKPHWWYYMGRNEIRFWAKHARGMRKAKALWWAYKAALVNLRTMGSANGLQPALLAGVWDGWLGRSGAYHAGRAMPRPVANLVLWHSQEQGRAAERTPWSSREPLHPLEAAPSRPE